MFFNQGRSLGETSQRKGGGSSTWKEAANAKKKVSLDWEKSERITRCGDQNSCMREFVSGDQKIRTTCGTTLKSISSGCVVRTGRAGGFGTP